MTSIQKPELRIQVKGGSPKTEGVANGLRRGMFWALRAVHGNISTRGGLQSCSEALDADLADVGLPDRVTLQPRRCASRLRHLLALASEHMHLVSSAFAQLNARVSLVGSLEGCLAGLLVVVHRGGVLPVFH